MRLTVKIPAGFAVVLILLLGSAAGCTEFNASAPPSGTAAEKRTKTIRLTAAQSNAGPVAGDIAETAAVGVRKIITLAGSTPDAPGMQLTYIIRSLPANGTLVDPGNAHVITTADVQQPMGYALANCGNQIEFTATSAGTESFTYMVHDGASISGEATVTITVTAAPKRAMSATRPTGEAASLPAGTYHGTLRFSNLTNNDGNTTRSVQLTIQASQQTGIESPSSKESPQASGSR